MVAVLAFERRLDRFGVEQIAVWVELFLHSHTFDVGGEGCSGARRIACRRLVRGVQEPFFSGLLIDLGLLERVVDGQLLIEGLRPCVIEHRLHWALDVDEFVRSGSCQATVGPD